MVADQQEEEKSYQRALRVVGRYLDSEPAFNVSISEISDGFTVRSHSTPRRADERVLHFEWDRLESLDQFYSGGRGVARRRHRHQDLWEHFPCGHEAALRKLGSILDAEGATSLSVDEVEGGLDVSYLAPAAGGGQMEKQQKTFGPDELCQ